MEMIKLRKLLMVGGLVAAMTLPSAAAKERSKDEATGAARNETNVERGERGTLRVTVDVDLTGVTTLGKAAVLGAYVARVDFDPAAVELLSVEGGRSAAFKTAPVSTDRLKANQDGMVKLTSYNTSDKTASGPLNVATLVFREKRDRGAQTIRVRFDSLASDLVKDSDGQLKQFRIQTAVTE
jgi:hypothetical protein